MKIDIHTHIIPSEFPDFAKKFGYTGFVRLEHYAGNSGKMMIGDKLFREIGCNCWDPGVRMTECEKHNVDMQVLSPIPVLFCYWAKPEHAAEISSFLNDHIAGIVHKYPDKFIGLGTLPLQAPELAIREMERGMKEMGLAGFEIGTNVNGKNLDDENLFPVFRAAEELGAAIFVHPWDMMGKDSMPKYFMPWLVGMPAETSRALCSLIFGGVFERLPRLRVAFAHGGGGFGPSFGRIEHAFRMRPDLCATDNPVNPKNYLGKFYVDSLTHDPRILRFLIDLIGEDMIVFGSDYPFPLGESDPGTMIDSMDDLKTNTKEKIFSRNAIRWLGLNLKV
ncbi:MAG: amidohydrolase [Bacteroidetes bacterium]|nr:amidohydrolase [Bacteroidota bacterium]